MSLAIKRQLYETGGAIPGREWLVGSPLMEEEKGMTSKLMNKNNWTTTNVQVNLQKLTLKQPS